MTHADSEGPTPLRSKSSIAAQYLVWKAQGQKGGSSIINIHTQVDIGQSSEILRLMNHFQGSAPANVVLPEYRKLHHAGHGCIIEAITSRWSNYAIYPPTFHID